MSQPKRNNLKLAWVQHTATACVDDNIAQITQALAQLKAQAPDVIVLPEAFAWLARDMRQMSPLIETLGAGRLQVQCQAWAHTMNTYLIAGSLPLRIGGQVYATLCVYNPQGQLETYYRKMHLFAVTTPTGQIYNENQFFSAGKVPVIWHSPWGAIGLSICFDLRFPELFRYYAQQGVRLVVLPSAFTQETGEAHWHILVRARAIENQMFLLAVNQTGQHEVNFHSYGHSILVDAWGRVLVDSGEASTQDCQEVDLSSVDALRQQFPVLAACAAKFNFVIENISPK
jgi:nitrilase